MESYPTQRRIPRSHPLKRRQLHNSTVLVLEITSSVELNQAQSVPTPTIDLSGPQAPLSVSFTSSLSASSWASSSLVSSTESSNTSVVSSPTQPSIQAFVTTDVSSSTSTSSQIFSTSSSQVPSLSSSQIPFPSRTIPLTTSSATSSPSNLVSPPKSSSQSSSQSDLIHSPPIYAAITIASVLVFAVFAATIAYIFRCCKRRKDRRKRMSLEEMIIEAANRDREMGIDYSDDIHSRPNPAEDQGQHLQIQFPTDPEFGTPRESVVRPRFLSLGQQGLDVPWAAPNEVNDAHIPGNLENGKGESARGTGTRALPQAPPPATLLSRGTLSRASSTSSALSRSNSNYASALSVPFCPSDPFGDLASRPYSYSGQGSFSSDSLTSLPQRALDPQTGASKPKPSMGWAFGFGSALSLTSLSSVSVHHSHPPAPHKIPANATAIDIPDVPIGVADPLSAEESHNRGWSASFKSGFVNAFHSAFGIRGNQEGKGQGRDGEKEDGLTRGPSRNRRLSERLGRKGTKTSSFTSWTIPESLSGEGLSEYDSGEKGGMEGELGGGRMHEAEKGLEREWIEYWGGELVGVAPGSASPGETEKLGKGLGLGLGLDPDQEHEHELTSTSESLIPAPAPLVIRKKSPSKTGSVSVSKRGTVKSVYSTYSTYSTRSGRSRTSMRSRTGVSRANSIMSVLDEKEEMAGRALRERWSRRKAIQEGREEEPEPGVES